MGTGAGRLGLGGDRVEARVVAEVEEDPPIERAVLGEGRPATTGDLVALVAALPGELDAGPPVTGRLAAVHPPVDDDEPEPPGPVAIELDERGCHQVDGVGVPQLHRYDPPPAGEVRHPRHPIPSTSLRERPTLCSGPELDQLCYAHLPLLTCRMLGIPASEPASQAPSAQAIPATLAAAWPASRRTELVEAFLAAHPHGWSHPVTDRLSVERVVNASVEVLGFRPRTT